MREYPLWQFAATHALLRELRDKFPTETAENDTLDDALWYLEEECLDQHGVDLEAE